MPALDLSKTLTQIENHDWGPPHFDSYLVTTCHRLRYKPLVEFTIGDLRILLGQGISAEHLVPLALVELERDPLAEGDHYPGDLLRAVLPLKREDFLLHPDQDERGRSIYRRAREALVENDYSTETFDTAARSHWVE